MSAEAIGWVWKHSPLRGTKLLVHVAVADTVNDLYGNEFWMSTGSLAEKARVSRNTVTTVLGDLVQLGYLEVVEAGGSQRKPTRYRFLMASAPSAHVVWSSQTAGTSSNRASTSAPGDTTSAISMLPLARPARTNPIEITQRTQGEPNALKAQNGHRQDVIWDAMLSACGISGPISPAARGAYNKARSDLAVCEATPEMIHQRAAVYRIRWPEVSLTPTALSRRWSECEPNEQHLPGRKVTAHDVAMARDLREAEELDRLEEQRGMIR